jgi:hypothetical protein
MEPDKQMLVCSSDTGFIYSIKNSFAGTCCTGNRGTATFSGIKKEKKPGLISKQGLDIIKYPSCSNTCPLAASI